MEQKDFDIDSLCPFWLKSSNVAAEENENHLVVVNDKEESSKKNNVSPTPVDAATPTITPSPTHQQHRHSPKGILSPNNNQTTSLKWSPVSNHNNHQQHQQPETSSTTKSNLPNNLLPIGSWCGERFCDILLAFECRDGSGALVEFLLTNYFTIDDLKIMSCVSSIWEQIISQYAFPHVNTISKASEPSVNWCDCCHRWRHNSSLFNIHHNLTNTNQSQLITNSSIESRRFSQSRSSLGSLNSLMNILQPAPPPSTSTAPQPTERELFTGQLLSCANDSSTSSSSSLLSLSSHRVTSDLLNCTPCLFDINQFSSFNRQYQFTQAAKMAIENENVIRCSFCQGAALHCLTSDIVRCWNDNCARIYCNLCFNHDEDGGGGGDNNPLLLLSESQISQHQHRPASSLLQTQTQFHHQPSEQQQEQTLTSTPKRIVGSRKRCLKRL